MCACVYVAYVRVSIHARVYASVYRSISDVPRVPSTYFLRQGLSFGPGLIYLAGLAGQQVLWTPISPSSQSCEYDHRPLHPALHVGSGDLIKVLIMAQQVKSLS